MALALRLHAHPLGEHGGRRAVRVARSVYQPRLCPASGRATDGLEWVGSDKAL